MPSAISEVGVGLVDGRVHVVGGTDASGQATTFHMAYDPIGDVWAERAPLPKPMHHVGVAELGGRLFAIGGLTENVHLGPQDSAFNYDPEADEWQALPPLPVPRGSIGVAAVAGSLHTFGGRTSERVVNVTQPGSPEMWIGIGTTTAHEVYDPDNGRWREAEPLPGPARDHMGIAVMNGRIHVFGGRINDYSDMLARHDVYDPATSTWGSAAPLPRRRSAGAFAVIGDLIVYAGGECRPGGQPFTPNAFDDVDGYEQERDTWEALSSLPEGRHAFGAATLGDVAYFVGGALVCGGGASTDVYALRIT